MIDCEKALKTVVTSIRFEVAQKLNEAGRAELLGDLGDILQEQPFPPTSISVADGSTVIEVIWQLAVGGAVAGAGLVAVGTCTEIGKAIFNWGCKKFGASEADLNPAKLPVVVAEDEVENDIITQEVHILDQFASTLRTTFRESVAVRATLTYEEISENEKNKSHKKWTMSLEQNIQNIE